MMRRYIEMVFMQRVANMVKRKEHDASLSVQDHIDREIAAFDPDHNRLALAI